MAFSFFRKKETEAEARPAMPGAPAAVESPPSKPVFADEGHQATAGIEVVNGGDVLTPAEEQAAILHANGASEEALAVLRPELERIRGQHQQQTWLMLFELQQQLGKQADYEALGLEYVLEFEKTPPHLAGRSGTFCQTATGSKQPLHFRAQPECNQRKHGIVMPAAGSRERSRDPAGLQPGGGD